MSQTSLLSEFVRHPREVGAVAPSGTTLTAQAVAPIPRTGDPVVVELGPGTGSFTAAIQRRLAGRGRHIAVEINPRMADLLARRFPGVEVITADAVRLDELLAEHGAQHADVIVSGLPWSVFPQARQRDVLDAAVRSLAVDGAFTTFAYVHMLWSAPARRLRRSLEERFDEVLVGRTVWANVPPALVYYCRRPSA
ncbi:methyltransferase domain-containing protein [Actinoplanes sp. TBRC 11911]|uniref:class I SAM-dependent methyltransferase n=1 Tax=Actinoplanes sp. TBRC 11911 TaxID=2729386 RepID=UPI00145EB735|nr:methyltransferase domain-containing protein [Actinoplanes sp. TBRC 11911]NMO49811.1 methyltransferase domain-containing protein [Actinoplanes sp. TBRC 11911]